MQDDTPSPTDPGTPQGAEVQRRAAFATTHWSVVLAAGRDSSADATSALAELCQSYWYPLYAYARRRGHGAEEARDLTQGFFAKLLEKGDLASADPGRGRFRTFLLSAMQNFMTGEWRRERAQKRGGDRSVLSLDFDRAEESFRHEPVDHLGPVAIFERRWALSLLERAVSELGEEYARTDRGELFEALKGFLGAGDDALPYPELAARTGRSEGSLRTAVSRLRARWRERLRELVAETVGELDDVEDELRILLDALGGDL